MTLQEQINMLEGKLDLLRDSIQNINDRLKFVGDLLEEHPEAMP